MENIGKYLKYLSCFLGLLLVISVFKNISYPLFWADESFTAMGSERVLKFGYPKAHDGKNVLNDIRCNDPKIAVNRGDDAFIGGANWGQYYYGVIGYLLASKVENLYYKTGIYRSTFAIIGLAGLILLVISLSKFFDDKFYKYLFISLFLLAELVSVSLILHLRQVRYYPLALFFSSSTVSLYVWYKFYKSFYSVIYSVFLALLLWIIFNTFSPLYVIFIFGLGISEITVMVYRYLKTKKLREQLIYSLPTVIAIMVSFAGVYPLLIYFRTFEMKKMLDDLYRFNSTQYWSNFYIGLKYFCKFECLGLAIVMGAFMLIYYGKGMKGNSKLFPVANFLLLLFILTIFLIPDIDAGIFTRYYICMQPILVAIALIYFIILLKLFSKDSKRFWNLRVKFLLLVFILLFGFTFTENLTYIREYIYEITHQYKGPLDYTIPYIKAHYDKPEDLIIATNYEETSYMYYLNSKVIVGYVGNNLPYDTIYQPQIIAFRQSKGSRFEGAFNLFLRRADFKYNRVNFPIKDIPINNTPELNFEMPIYNHYFKTLPTDNVGDEERLDIRM